MILTKICDVITEEINNLDFNKLLNNNSLKLDSFCYLQIHRTYSDNSIKIYSLHLLFNKKTYVIQNNITEDDLLGKDKFNYHLIKNNISETIIKIIMN